MNPHPIDTPGGARPTASLTNTERAQIASTASELTSLSQSFIPREALPRMGRGIEGEGKKTLQAAKKHRGFRMTADKRMIVGIGIAIGIGIVSLLSLARRGPATHNA